MNTTIEMLKETDRGLDETSLELMPAEASVNSSRSHSAFAPTTPVSTKSTTGGNQASAPSQGSVVKSVKAIWQMPAWIKLLLLITLSFGIAFAGWLRGYSAASVDANMQNNIADKQLADERLKIQPVTDTRPVAQNPLVTAYIAKQEPQNNTGVIDWRVRPQLTKTLSSDWQEGGLEAVKSSASVSTYALKTESSPQVEIAQIEQAKNTKINTQLATKNVPNPTLLQETKLVLTSKHAPKKMIDKTVEKMVLPKVNMGDKANVMIAKEASIDENLSLGDMAKKMGLTTQSASQGKVVTALASKKPNANVKPNSKLELSSLANVGSTIVQKQMNPEQEANQFLQRAMDMYQKGRLYDAITASKEALNTNPQSIEARQLLASYLVDTKQLPEAMQVLQQGAQLQPKHLAIHKSLARLQISAGQLESAINTLQKGAETTTPDADYLAMWALTLQKMGQHKQALPLFEKAINTTSNHVPWMVSYGVSLQAEGRTQEALSVFKQASGLPASERIFAFIQQRIQYLEALNVASN